MEELKPFVETDMPHFFLIIYGKNLIITYVLH